MKTITRENYLSLLLEYEKSDLIKIITGTRRIGKSFLLQQLKKELVNKKEVLYMDLETYSNKKYRDPFEFQALIQETFPNQKEFYLLIDEVQLIDDWESFLPGIRNEFNVNIYVTGSTNKLLPENLPSSLSGRTVSMKVLPFSLKEFMELYDLDNKEEALEKYFVSGGFPFFLQNDMIVESVFDDFKKTIIENDIRAHNNEETRTRIDAILDYLSVYMGNQVSINNITKHLAALFRS